MSTLRDLPRAGLPRAGLPRAGLPRAGLPRAGLPRAEGNERLKSGKAAARTVLPIIFTIFGLVALVISSSPRFNTCFPIFFRMGLDCLNASFPAVLISGVAILNKPLSMLPIP